MNFIDKNVSVKQAIIILAKNGIQINENEATIILELLYLVSKNYNKQAKLLIEGESKPAYTGDVIFLYHFK
ncbi:hypothetical protein [Elizabethkingia anophelis]|uniref:hypothetical protein n=1 Tax=Elizabethkingia anophelis TaxID=1117645 RepID=UPI00259BBA2C|nr:hypothetical protein [Elizabethkingia anophelis]WJK01283.1 hypothetical protein QTN78_06015 [Elizabethkingia anophelis]